MTSENTILVFSCVYECSIYDSICGLIYPEFKICAQVFISDFSLFIVLLELCVMIFVIFITLLLSSSMLGMLLWSFEFHFKSIFVILMNFDEYLNMLLTEGNKTLFSHWRSYLINGAREDNEESIHIYFVLIHFKSLSSYLEMTFLESSSIPLLLLVIIVLIIFW